MAGSAAEGRAHAATSTVFAWNYGQELDRALRALWEGTLARAAGLGAAR